MQGEIRTYKIIKVVNGIENHVGTYRFVHGWEAIAAAIKDGLIEEHGDYAYAQWDYKTDTASNK